VPAVLLTGTYKYCRTLLGGRRLRMAQGKPTDPVQILANLIRRGLDRKGWSPEDAFGEAKRRRLKGLSPHNIRDYLNERRKRRPTERVIRRFAALLGEPEETWLAQFPGYGFDPLLLGRDTVIGEQAQLQDGDEVTIISSRAFLEATDIDVAEAVLRNLNRGIAYTYYFPVGTPNAHGTTASESYQRFRDHAARFRFSRRPLLFGYAVDPGRFRFFSGLQTLVHYSSRTPGVTKTYAYIEPMRGDSGRTEQVWYLVPEDHWRDVISNLREARSFVADADLPIVPLNPCLPRVRGDYIRWFQRVDSGTRYGALRPVLGHAAERCVRALMSEVARTRRNGDPVRYLDVGCGDGAITRAIADEVGKQWSLSVMGVDVSDAQIRLAKATFRDAKEFPFVATEGAFENFQSADMFDLITAVHSLYTVDEAYVRRIYQLLAPGGIACIWMAMRKNNVVSAVCDAVDAVLRPGQLRNAAEDLERYARGAGLSVALTPFPAGVPCLLDSKGRPTAEGQKLIDFCALQTVKKDTPAWQAAVAAMQLPAGAPGGDHPLTDGLIVIQRHRS
jgi:SAM-dependent methyltransferase